jgi:diguanylate cyclase (GGDEF)-like protein
MPSPGAPKAPSPPLEDAYLELLSDTLEGLESSARAQFLTHYFRVTTQLELPESKSVELWEEILTRRRAFNEALGRTVSLRTVLTDVLSTSGLLRVPALIEYDELKRIRLSAVTDPLTGLYNRRLFAESFEKELNRARRYGLPLGIVILDLHRFKEVNDKYGHPRGDDVLRAAAATLQRALRTSDSAFRIGGDEFAVLLPQTDAAHAIALSRRIEAVFAEILRPLRLSFAVTMDHGVATFPQDGDQVEQLIHVADERLYRFKHASHVRGAAESARAEGPSSETPLAPPAPIPISTGRAPEALSTDFAAASSAAAGALSGQSAPPESNITYAMQRKAERISMSGTNAYAVIGEQGTRRARVLDLGFGGVALEFEHPEDLPESIVAILHVPILPPVRVYLRPVWSCRTAEGAFRFGCQFVS